MSGCPKYRILKTRRGQQNDAHEWGEFITWAEKAEKQRTRYLVALKAMAKRWGREIAEHYEWASKYVKYREMLRTFAREYDAWDAVVNRFNLILIE